ncbi:MAG: RnfABCDGE type electron transport complex subunit D [Thermotogota bacterium]|nr:RnfABCDGE type electron transport complex subunit D [Thermotogota bacterium]HOI62762.1 RnfABCDGE type electron transport complex subunit D [Mesotoga sp.]
MQKKFFQKQPMMRKVIYSLIPILIFAIGNFGWVVLIKTFLSTFMAVFIEWLFERKKGKPVSEAVIVTGLLVGLILPPAVPFWIVIVSSSFGVVFAKMAFGGFAKNLYNPAMVGRAFVYVSFPAAVQQSWTPAVSTWGQGFGRWIASDIVTMATPVNVIRGGGDISMWKMFFGNVSGTSGETAKWLIIAAAVYLIITKTASWKIILSTLVSAFVMSGIIFLFDPTRLNPLAWIFGGSILFGAVFMATDPISAPKKERSKWIYGGLIGALSVVIGTFSLFGAGFMFALLIANTFASLIDYLNTPGKVKKS